MLDYEVKVVECEKKAREIEMQIVEKLGAFHRIDWLLKVGNELKIIVAYSGDGTIKGYLPLVKTLKNNIRSYHIPPFTPYYGPIVFETDILQKQILFEKILLPLKGEAHMDFLLSLDDGDVLPFLKLGFQVEARQNHYFPPEKVYSTKVLNSGKARDIKRILKRVDIGEIQLLFGNDAVKKIIELQLITGERKGFATQEAILSNLLNIEEERYFSVAILDQSGEAIAAAFCPTDKFSMYHLIGASKRVDDKVLNLSNYLVCYLCVEEANKRKLRFDFEGSSLPGVAQFYRMMGGIPQVKYRLQKSTSVKLHLLRAAQRLKIEKYEK